MKRFKTPVSAIRQSLSIIAITLYLAGCSIPTPTTHEQSSQVSATRIQQHQQRLYSISRWQLSARLALFQKRSDERDGVYLDWQWQRQNNRQQLRFSHPLRGQLATLSIQPRLTTLSYDGNQYQGRSPEALLQRLFNTPIPVTQLRNWALGQYTAALQSVQYLTDGRLGQALYNDPQSRQWQINWYYADDSQPVNSAVESKLPTQVHIESADFRIKLQMNQWQIEQDNDTTGAQP